ncbi:Minor capsid VP2 [Gossypium arboreum]|uniref:Minor capsid VP2 n=1 Tax=Gossypium arboreum TaxID=29729 RepID=A0A0B0PLK1_GOSAR|nr:Minor capsid VP2 [Gossypium arboreum]
MGQSTKSTRPGLPHTGRPQGRVNLAKSKHDYTGRTHTRAILTGLSTGVSHGCVPAEPKLSPIRKRLISRVFRHSKAYKYTLDEEEREHREKEERKCSREAD